MSRTLVIILPQRKEKREKRGTEGIFPARKFGNARISDKVFLHAYLNSAASQKPSLWPGRDSLSQNVSLLDHTPAWSTQSIPGAPRRTTQ